MKSPRPRKPHAGLRRFDAVMIAAHWTTLALIVGMFATAWLYGQATDNEQANRLLTWHRSLGVTVWAVTLGRVVWRVGFAAIPALPAEMPRIQKWAAKANEYAIYALLLIQPLTGLAQSFTRGRAFSLFGLAVPVVMAKDKPLTAVFHAVHELSAWALLGLIGVHALAALFHRFVLRDHVLQSMLPLPAMASSRRAKPPRD